MASKWMIPSIDSSYSSSSALKSATQKKAKPSVNLSPAHPPLLASLLTGTFNEYAKRTGTSVYYGQRGRSTPARTTTTRRTTTNKATRSTNSGYTRRASNPYAAQQAAQKAADAKAKAEKDAKEKKQNAETKKQVDALLKLAKGGFDASRDTKLGNLQRSFDVQDAALLDAYGARVDELEDNRDAVERAEHDDSQLNLRNLVRERSEALGELYSKGAGETDVLMGLRNAVRNWESNQQDVVSAYYDTLRNVQTNLTNQTEETRLQRVNLYNQLNRDRSKVWDDYYNQISDTYNQIANIENQNQNDSFTKQVPDAIAKMGEYASKSYKEEAIPSTVTKWKGRELTQKELNTSSAALPHGYLDMEMKKPEGASLRRWT